jgi:hypothetical protein
VPSSKSHNICANALRTFLTLCGAVARAKEEQRRLTQRSRGFVILDISVYPCRTNGRTIDLRCFSEGDILPLLLSPMARRYWFQKLNQNWAQALALWFYSNPPPRTRHDHEDQSVNQMGERTFRTCGEWIVIRDTCTAIPSHRRRTASKCQISMWVCSTLDLGFLSNPLLHS